MWLIVGLGNPGDKYVHTRHNVGFTVIDLLASSCSIELKNRTRNCIHGRGFIEDKTVILMKPLTFMNLSGIAVQEIIKKYEDITNVLVIHDDLDLPPGTIKIREKGSSGGHRGIDSIIERLGSKDFIRLKIGIGRSLRISPENYVLRPFYKKEKPLIDEALHRAVDAIQEIILKDVSSAQNKYNKSF
ncbi:aminoacyl-tRNA hydrolase [bacterium]|nr:MAG: aminoacyl-tRNA hydrolase [bacterium]